MSTRRRSAVARFRRSAVRKVSYGAGFAYGSAIAAKRAVGRFGGRTRHAFRGVGRMASGAGMYGLGLGGAVRVAMAGAPGLMVIPSLVGIGTLSRKGVDTFRSGYSARKGKGAFGGKGAFSGRGRGWKKFAKGRKR